MLEICESNSSKHACTDTSTSLNRILAFLTSKSNIRFLCVNLANMQTKKKKKKKKLLLGLQQHQVSKHGGDTCSPASYLHEVKVHYSRDLCLDCLHPAFSIRERPGVTAEGDLHLIPHCYMEEKQLQKQKSYSEQTIDSH